MYEKSLYLYSNNDLKSSLELLNKIININSNFPPAWILKGKILLNQGEYNNSIECLEYSIQISPENYEPWLYKANILKSLEKFYEALLYYVKVLKLDANNKEALIETCINIS